MERSGSTTRLEEAALSLAERGYKVFPCQPRSKKPLTPHGFKDSSRDERQILHWWDAHPDANIGVDCGGSGILVFDIDAKHGADPEDVLAERDTHGAPIVLTGEAPERSAEHPRSLTGTRGAQVFFRGAARTTDKLTIPGTEIRSIGAYVIVPPSAHPSGVAYEGELPATRALPEAPAWLLEAIVPRNGSGPAASVGPVIPKGEQHKALVSLAGTMRRRGMEADEIEAALLVTNAKRLESPAPPGNIRRIAESVAKYPPGEAVNGAAAVAHGDERFVVTYTEKGALKLPKAADVGDQAGHCAWLTSVFALNRMHPIIAGAREGGKGAEGHVALRRLDAPSLRFEPVSRINTPQRLAEDLSWQTLPSDGAVPPFKGEHCRSIANVIKMLCGVVASHDAAQETAGIVGSYLSIALPVEGRTTYGSGRDRYAAAEALRRTLNEEARQPTSPPRYLIDANTGELVIPLDELQIVARGHVGSLGKGWLDARMENLGWRRVTLDGHGIPGENGRQGFHIRRDVYRGHLPASDQGEGDGDE